MISMTFTVASAKTDASIQNISDLPQGLAGPLCPRLDERKAERAGGRRR